MRILISAIACSPERGSEAYVGWNAVQSLSKDHDLWVLTHGNDRAAIERAQAAGAIGDNVRFTYHRGWDARHPNRIIARLQNWLDYSAWLKDALRTAAKLDAEVDFDLIHHLTMVSWRVGLPYWKLGKPLVWGPVGGAEQYPPAFYPLLSRSTIAYEVLRSGMNLFSKYSPAVRNCCRQSAAVVASNRTTAKLLQQAGAPAKHIHLLSASFFNDRQIDKFQQLQSSKPPATSCLNCFAGGDIEGRKGMAIALHALAILKQRGIRFHYQVAGSGPEIAHLQRLASKLDIADSVIIGAALSGTDYVAKLQQSHVYLLPSLRDNSPITLMEAMLAKCVPVIADCGGPTDIVTDSCGIKIPINNPQQTINGVADALARLATDSEHLSTLAAAASQRVAEHYSEHHYQRRITAIYQAATKAAATRH